MEKPSKEQVKQAGKRLKEDASDKAAMDILSRWRRLHAIPINTFQALLRHKARELKMNDVVVAQRLKRTPSIVKKLQRFPNMSLATMQDIGGIRAIVPKVSDVYVLHKAIVEARHKHEPQLPPKDYIQAPKPDGYRSLHQTFKYVSDNEASGLMIELQIRTQLQHAWATAVETLGLIEKTSFKTGEGAEEFKRFFKLASALFAYEEQQVIVEELKDCPIASVALELWDLQIKFNIFSKLKGLLITGNHISQNKPKGNGYYLMNLDTQKLRVELTYFTEDQLDWAAEIYKMLEIENLSKPHMELVLISAQGFKNIQRSYPNYFLDTQMFIQRLEMIMGSLMRGGV